MARSSASAEQISLLMEEVCQRLKPALFGIKRRGCQVKKGMLEETYFAHAILIGPYGTYALNISNANHLSPSGTVHTASTTAVKKPQKVDTDISAGRLRQWSEKMAKRTVRTSWTAACEVGMTLMSSIEYFPVAFSQRVNGWTEPEGCCIDVVSVRVLHGLE